MVPVSSQMLEITNIVSLKIVSSMIFFKSVLNCSFSLRISASQAIQGIVRIKGDRCESGIKMEGHL